jgi:FixJ family two-component response regulator
MPLQDRLNTLGSRVPVIFVTGHPDVPTTVQVMKAGAEDLLTKPVTKEALVQAIERAHTRFRINQEKHKQLDLLRTLVSRLSPREYQVFERVVQGEINKEIARELGSTERTIKAHRRRVMEKIQVASLAELAIIAERIGIFASVDEATECRPAKP